MKISHFKKFIITIHELQCGLICDSRVINIICDYFKLQNYWTSNSIKKEKLRIRYRKHIKTLITTPSVSLKRSRRDEFNDTKKYHQR